MLKAKCRGLNLILPQDVIIGDEPLNSAMLEKPYVSFDKDVRDEGGDYDGESTTVPLFSPVEGDVLPHAKSIQGAPFDIGPNTCQLIRAEIPRHHLHLSWGTAGCCELSSFQAGQRALIEASRATYDPKATIQMCRNLVVGESTVEWWSRICDPEGEFDGNIVKKGIAEYTTRTSAPVSAALGHVESPCLSKILRREPSADEWDYISEVRREDPEEEDEEEEEDD
jgi:hypothetical protein